MIVKAIIEIPQGSANKYEVNPVTGQIRLDRVLYSATYYPVNYGFIPASWGEDNDPLDILVLASTSIHPGVEVDVRVIGTLLMTDEHGPDAKIVGVADADPRWGHVTVLDDVGVHRLREIRHFFSTYKELQGLPVTMGDYEGMDTAQRLIGEAFQRYQNRQAERGELDDRSDY